MQFVDNINPNPLASRNAADITLQAPNVSKVNILVTAGEDSFAFDVEPYSGVLKIRLADILNSILQPIFLNPSHNSRTALIPEVSILATALPQRTDSATWSRLAFLAGYDKAFHDSLMGDYFWTWKDQVCRTFASGKEYLAAIFHDESTAIEVEATFSDGSISTETPITITASDEEYKIAIFDVSPQVIEEMFPGETVVSYKIQKGGSVYRQAYEISRRKPTRTFIFRNSLGVFDTVYATGRISDGATFDVKKFIGEDRAENISNNNSREHIYVNSGYIETRGERALWNDLALAADAWEYSDGAFRKIVIDKFDMKLQRGLADSLTFEYHYSEAPTGTGYEKVEL